ncbi:hypothetical protein BDZ94DRAFT_1326699 [Collybia nuda]|uniref:VWFA domain-containing protein n=1 Tax=Collybia nuda TaxID=64659 RepID=A0A9P5XWH3_9AGAR|nr:hypothetical protein BDZ94DRAFT_1326699 [Collybia nuda]
MNSPVFDNTRSPLFNRAMRGQLPPQTPVSYDYRQSPNHSPYDYKQPLPHDSRKPNEVIATQSNLLEELYGSARKPRTFKQWEDAARLNTQKIREQGSPSPLVWVFVKGKEIPANAILAGEERRQPLYIARTFYENGLFIGRAGRHLERGASISYNGLEVHVDSYEVLVPALQPIRYSISSTVQMPPIPRIVGDTTITIRAPGTPRAMGSTPLTPHIMSHTPVEKSFERLNMIKTVILVDDSASMAGGLWADAREALAGITDLNGQVSSDGVDVYFMNDHRNALNCREGAEVRMLFNSVNPCGETPIGRKLQELFEKYIPLIENKSRFHRPITIVVITDGVPTDEPADVIVEAARRLDHNNVPLKQFGIQFAQIGNDPEATEALRELDDDLSKTYQIRDMVDTTPYNPKHSSFTRETLVKILLGAFNQEVGSVPNRSLNMGPILL